MLNGRLLRMTTNAVLCGMVCLWFSRVLCDPHYYAVAGRKTSLPCNITIPLTEDTVALILWYRGNSGIPIYSLDARSSPVKTAKHLPGDEFGKRAYFDVIANPPVLKLDPVKEEDQGEYRCRVDYRRFRSENRNLQLEVIVPPGETIIKDEHGQRLQDVIGPFDEGTHLTLVCEVEGGRPLPLLTWWRESTLMDDTYIVTPQGVVRNEISIPRLKRLDLLAELTCQASNTNLTVPVSSSVSLDLNLKPLDVRITTVQRPLSAGMKAQLTCQSTGARPPAQLSWWKGSKKVHTVKETISQDGNVTFSVLKFVPNIDDDGKYLSCRADNPSLPTSALEDGWKLNVYYVPRLRLALGANIKHSAIREGSDVYFECNINANPRVTEVGWKFRGEPLFSQPSSGLIISNQSLVLQKVSREHRGYYQCVAANVEGEGESEKVMLNVQYSPFCKSSEKILYGVARGEEAHIKCEVEADPPDVTFQWSLNNSFENRELRGVKTNGTVSVALYTPGSRLDYGYLFCYGVNSIGKQKDPCIFKVVPAGPPDPLRKCVNTNQTSTSLEIVCEPGDDGGLKQKFYLEVYNALAVVLQSNHSSDSAFFVVGNLPPGTSFNLVLYAGNEKGRSNTVAMAATTLPVAQRRTADKEQVTVSPVLGVLIGIVGALVIVAVAIVVVMRLRGEEEKRSKEAEAADKPEPPAVKNEEHDMVVKKGPDVIPPQNGSPTQSEEKAFSDIARYMSHPMSDVDLSMKKMSLSHSPISPMVPEEVTYAELSLSQFPNISSVRRQEPPTEYAQIDFQWQARRAIPPNLQQQPPTRGEEEEGVETPLISSIQRSSNKFQSSSPVDRSTISTPV